MVLVSSFALTGTEVSAQSSPAAHPSAEATRMAYEGELKKANEESARNIESLMSKYSKALESLQDKCQSSGDLKGVLRIKEELDRLATDNRPPDIEELSTHAKLLDLQQKCIEAVNGIELSKSRTILAAVNEYTTQLEERKKQLTIDGDFESAQKYAAEIERIKSSEEGRAAANHLHESSKRDAAPTKNAPVANEITAVGSTRCKVYRGRQGPPIQGVEMEDQSLVGTRQAGSLSTIYGSAKLGSRSDIDQTRRSSSYSTSKSVSGEVEVLLRLTLKARSAKESLTEPLVLVQYFGADVEAKGLVKPEQIAAEPLRLNAITNQEVTIDFPAVALKKSEYSYRSSYSRYSRKSGKEFYGVMITIFDENQNLIYQSVNNSSLRDHGHLALGAIASAEKDADMNAAKNAYEQARDAYHASLRTGENREDLQEAYHEARDRYYKLRSSHR